MIDVCIITHCTPNSQGINTHNSWASSFFSPFFSFFISSILLLTNAQIDLAVLLTVSPAFFASSFSSPLVIL